MAFCQKWLSIGLRQCLLWVSRHSMPATLSGLTLDICYQQHVVLNQPCGQRLSILTSGVDLHIFKPNPRCSSVLGKAELPVRSYRQRKVQVSWALPGGPFPPHVCSLVCDFNGVRCVCAQNIHTCTHAHLPPPSTLTNMYTSISREQDRKPALPPT